MRRPLPVLDPVVADGAPVKMSRPAIARGVDRWITFGGVLAAAVMLALAAFAAAAAVGSAAGGAVWLPLHLALAGGAGTAIAAVLPFFTTALARVAPAHPALRLTGVGFIAGGAVVASIGMTDGTPGIAALGGGAYLVGLGAIALSAFLPLRATIGFRLRIIPLAYAVALAEVGVGVTLATAMLAGWAPIAAAWATLKPAHAWLNVFGFVTVVVAASLIHLAPTVAGSLIRSRRSATIGLAGLMAGAPLVALGLATGSNVAAGLGGVVELVGAAALAVHGAVVQRDRGRWTSDHGWHRFAGLSLLAAPAWLLVALTIGVGRIVWLGATPAAWSVGLLAMPLVAGAIGQVLVGAWTHLVPAIGPGNQAVHAIQRRWLGRGSTPRWLAWNGGVALATIGLLTGNDGLAVAGGALFGAALVSALAMLVASVAFSSRRAPAAAGAAR